MKEYKYKAFISYRHISPDMEAAEKLQKLLEAYKPPKNLADKKEHWRIFRDVSELQSSSDLSEDIRNAIEDSEFLIVICSPAYSQSKWCMQELVRFRELHGDTNENIITLLVDGEPDKAFPELLRFAEMRSVDEDGRESTVRVEVEPLAANIKADSLRESMKKLNTEYLRIAAPLLGCDFNDLYQREKKREAQRRMRIFGSAFAVLAVITVISAASAITIKKKNSEINDKNEQIGDQLKKIEEQYSEIEKQYSELVLENAQNLAAESEILYKSSSLIPAIQKAVEALPSSEGEKPAIPEAQFALSKEMGMFSSENNVPQYALKHEYAIEKLSFMGGGKSIVSQDSSGIYFWNAEDGSLIRKLSPDDDEFAAPDYARNYLTAIIEPDMDKTGTVISKKDSDPNELESSVFDLLYDGYSHSVSDSESGTGGDVFVYNSNGTVWRMNGATGEIIWRAEADTNMTTMDEMIFDGENLLRCYNKTSDSDTVGISSKPMVDIISAEDGSIKKTADLSGICGSGLNFDNAIELKAFRDDTLYFLRSYSSGDKSVGILAYGFKDGKPEMKWEQTPDYGEMSRYPNMKLSLFGGDPVLLTSCSYVSEIKTSVIRFDKNTGEPVWECELPVRTGKNSRAFILKADDLGSSEDVLVITDETCYSLVGYGSGKLIDSVALDENITSVSFSRSGLLMFTAKSGREYVVKLSRYFTNDPKRLAYLIQDFGQPSALCSYSRGRYVLASDYSNTAYIQFTAKNSSYTGISAGEDKYCQGFCAANSDGSRVLAMYYDKTKQISELYICDTVSGKAVRVDTEENPRLLWAHFLTGDRLAVCLNGSDLKYRVYFIDIETGKLSEVTEAGNVTPVFSRNGGNIIQSSGVLGDSVYFFTEAPESNLKKLSPDGTVTTVELEFCNSRIYGEIGNKAALVFYDDYSDKLEFYSFDSGNFVTADHSFDSSGDDQIIRVFSINDKTAGVLVSSRSVLVFDTETGKLINELKLNSIRQELISAQGIGNDRFIILSRDLKLYEADLNGLTGKVIDLSDSIKDLGFITGDVNSDMAAEFNVLPAADSGCFYAVWDDSSAWYIDAGEFKLRYAIGSFAFAPPEKAVILTYEDENKRLGSFPVYTAQQLVDAAGEYLRRLGEAVKEDK